MTEDSPTQPISDSPTPAGPASPTSVWTRIKDHKIAQWTLAYAAAALALLEGAKLMSDAFEWPHQVFRIVTVLLILGLPLVVTLAWYHGHRALRRVSGAELAIITVLLVIASAVLWHFAHAPAEAVAPTAVSTHLVTATPAVPVSSKSIAVLPFVDMSEKHDQEYFSDGLSEELIDHLAHIPDLKVIARTSSFAFKGKNEDMRSIATKLGVANLLEGSVRKAGGELRITAQLIRASDGVHLWSEIYDRELKDIFKVQDEISTTVAKELNLALGAASRPVAVDTTSIAAYNLILQGNYFFNRYGEGDTEKAIEFYRQATALEPKNAVAWASMAEAYVDLAVDLGRISYESARPQAQAALQHALAIDSNLAKAHFALGKLHNDLELDWDAAAAEFERAVTLDNRGDVAANAKYKIALIKAGKSGNVDGVVQVLTQNVARNPLDATNFARLGLFHFYAGHLEDSAAAFRQLLELNPAYAGGQANYAATLQAMGKQSEALAAAEKEPDELTRLYILPCIYWKAGRHADSDKALRRLEDKFADNGAFGAALGHTCRGEANLGLEWLERAYRQRDGNIELVKYHPWLRPLHADPRYKALLRKMKMSE